MKYSHRIAVEAGICFDLESDNNSPTLAEVDEAVGWLVDGADIDGLSGGRVYLTTRDAMKAHGFSVEDTVENDEEAD